MAAFVRYSNLPRLREFKTYCVSNHVSNELSFNMQHNLFSLAIELISSYGYDPRT